MFFQFEVIVNAFVSFCRFMCIPMLWVYGHYKYVNSYSAVIDIKLHKLTTIVDHRAVRVHCRRIPYVYRVYCTYTASVNLRFSASVQQELV